MEEVKFRAWIENEKYMMSWREIKNHITDLSNVKIKGKEYDFWTDEKFLKEQYIGLKDKNGKEIYEGDILRDGKGGDAEVKYHPNTAMFLIFEGNESWYLNEGDPNRPDQLQYTEIISNIHEGKS